MRNHLEILEDIDKVLADNDLEAERSAVKDELENSRTNAEICMNCGLALLTLQKANPLVNTCIGDLIQQFIVYCSSNGIRVKLSSS
jgi:hypothetical protein